MTVAIPSAAEARELRCPYCSDRLDGAPRSKSSCPSCARSIWVGDAPDGRRYLIGENELADHTARWSEHHDRERWISAAEPFVDPAGFSQLEAELADEGRAADLRDVYWTAAERVLPLILASGRYDVIRDAYLAMARVEYEEGGSADRSERAVTLAREAAAAQLRLIGRGRIEIVPCDCEPCGRDVSSAEVSRELVTQRLPHPNCQYGWCGCEYRPAGRSLALVSFGRH